MSKEVWYGVCYGMGEQGLGLACPAVPIYTLTSTLEWRVTVFLSDGSDGVDDIN